MGLPDNTRITSTLTINGGTAWHAGNDGATSALDAGLLYGVQGNLYASSLSTGLLYGGLLSINAGNTATFDVSAGAGYIVTTGATFTAEPTPVITRVAWTAQTGVTLSGLTAQDTTWIYFDSNGNLNQQSAFFTDDQVQSTIAVGALVHPSRAYISLAKTIPNVSYATDKQYEQFIRAFGPLKVSGHTIQANGANLKLNRTSGTAFILGRNYPNDPNNPSVISDNAQTDCTFWRYYRGATAGSFVTVLNQTAIDPENYDDGTGTLNSVPSNKPFTIQRLFFFPGTPSVLGVYYGHASYASISEAANNVNFEDFTEITNTATNAVFVGYVLVKKGTTNLTTAIAADDARIIQSGQFRSTTSGGGTIATNLDSLNDVTITSVQDDDLLIYDTATSQWLNTPLQHIGVTRVNGATGAITSIAVTGSNTFTGLQTMTAGITASHLYVSTGATFASLATFSSGLSSGSTITVNNAIQVAQPAANTTALILRTRATNSNFITINATGGNVTVAPGTGVLRVTQGYGSSGTITNSSRGYLTLQGTDGDALSWDVTIDPSTALSASRTLTCPNLSGTLAVVNAAQTFSSLQSFTAGITANALYVSTGATFASRPSFPSGLTTDNLWVTNGATFAGTSVHTGLGTFNGGITANNLWVTNGATFANNIFAPNIVNSVNGITGAVGITAGSNITITQSGLTFTIASSGGGGGMTSTVANTFSALQTFTAGITANNLWVTNGATFAGAVSSDTGYRVSSSAVNTQTGTSYSLTASDNGKIITMNNGATSTVTIIGGLPVGFNATIIQLGAGSVGFTSASGVTLNSFASSLNMAGQHGAAAVISYATNIFNLSGTLTV